MAQVLLSAVMEPGALERVQLSVSEATPLSVSEATPLSQPSRGQRGRRRAQASEAPSAEGTALAEGVATESIEGFAPSIQLGGRAFGYRGYLKGQFVQGQPTLDEAGPRPRTRCPPTPCTFPSAHY